MTRAMRRPRGFTLVELLAVIAVVAMLAALLLPALTRAQRQSRATVWRATLAGLARHPEAKGVYDMTEGRAHVETAGDGTENRFTTVRNLAGHNVLFSNDELVLRGGATLWNDDHRTMRRSLALNDTAPGVNKAYAAVPGAKFPHIRGKITVLVSYRLAAQTSVWQTPISKGDVHWRVHLYANTTAPVGSFNSGLDAREYNKANYNSGVDGRWHAYAVSYDPATGRYTEAYDGRARGTIISAPGQIAANEGRPLSLGVPFSADASTTSDRWFKGWIDGAAVIAETMDGGDLAGLTRSAVF